MYKKYQKNFLKVTTSQRYKNLVFLYSKINEEIYKWMFKNNIFVINLPITTQSISSPMGFGSDSLPYKVFEKDTNFEFYLADSMQFYLELLLRVQNVDKIGYIANTFRGEKINARHLHQFNHFEIEIKGDLKKCQRLIQNLIKSITKNIINAIPDALNYFDKNNTKRLNDWIKKPFKNIKHYQAVLLLRKNGMLRGISTIANIDTINSWGEQKLIDLFPNHLIWITNFPSRLIPFYQKNINSQGVNADLLIGIGETIGGGERWENAIELKSSMKPQQIQENKYQWYFQMKKDFPIKTAGFGMGLERYLLFLINEKDIRNVQLIPRTREITNLP